jgi:hypothetical protein
MSNEIKLTEEEVKQITDVRKTYFNIQTAIGQLELTRINLQDQEVRINEQSKSVREEYSKTQQGERELVKSLQDKYGIGTLNVENGTFNPAPEQPAPAEKATTEKK